MTTAQRVLLMVAVLGLGATAFYFAYWQSKDTVTPTDVQALQAQSGLTTAAS